MKTKFRIVFLIILFILTFGLFALIGAKGTIAVFTPKGWVAEQERDLIITASLLMMIVVVPVFILTTFFAWRYRKGNEKASYLPEWGHSTFYELLWWGVPFVIILILSIITWQSTHKLNPFSPIPHEKEPMRIQVVALEWKWLFLYPEDGIATINFVQFPKQRPIRFEITGDAPMNSFWIPQLAGQIYAMPAMRTELNLIANEAGDYRGSSAHISGHGFAGMVFTARASSEEEYQNWIEEVKSSARRELNWQSYQSLTQPSSYLPKSYYLLREPSLFDRIIKQYMSR